MRQIFASSRKVLVLLGPAFVAAVAYVDPGNFATNFSAGALYGYLLLWVVIVANLMAGLVQYLSAKVGIVTGKSLPEVIAENLSRRARIGYWLQAELVAMATDIAEVIGGAIALQLIFGLPLLAGGLITGFVSLLLLVIYAQRGQKLFERIIIGLLLIIPLGFIAGLVLHPPQVHDVVSGLIPRLHGTETVFLAVAMLGATIMPHVVYIHSAMARDRHGGVAARQRQRLLRITKLDVGVAMVIAGGVNIAMLLLAASSLHGYGNTSTFNGIFTALQHATGPLVALLFALGLLVSGFASTAVGSYAGSVVMEGLIQRSVTPYVRRSVVIIPAIVLLAFGFEPTRALILSQVALSFGIPFALVPLALVTASQRIMGRDVNSRRMNGLLFFITGSIIILNIVLIRLTLFSA
jgi:manganese transport protein